MPTRTSNGVTLSFEERGPSAAGAPALVLLHGFPLDRRVWQDQLGNQQTPGVSDVARVIAPDLRGFGESKSTASFTLEDLADDVHALLSDLGALPAVLGGLSMGGYVALAYAKKYPTDLRGLVLIDTKAEGDTTEGKQGREKMIALVKEKGSAAVAEQMMPKMMAPDAPAQRPHVARQIRSIMEACPPQTIAHALAAMRDRPDHTCDLPSVPAPTLIIVGEHDAITPPEKAQAMAGEIPNVELVTIAGAGHMSPMEQPQQVNDALRRFVKSLA
jgi:pimeloyl-ACP methyl ester carboxylesterase